LLLLREVWIVVNSSLYTPDVIRNYLDEKIWDLSSLKTICEKNSLLFPDKEAVVDSKSRLTWVDVKQQSDQLALGLLKLGLSRDDRIIAQLYNCVELYLLMVACQKAGVILTLVPPNFREASLEPIAKHTKARAAVIPWKFRGHDFYSMFTEMKAQVPDLQRIIVIGDEIPSCAISLKDLSNTPITARGIEELRKHYIEPYEISRIGNTSGSTGIPKLYEIIESPYMLVGKNLIKRFAITENDTVGAFYNIMGGGLSIIAVTATPMVRAKLVLSEHFSPEEFCKLVAKERITIACLVPTEMTRLIDYPDVDKYDLSSLRLLANSTAVLPYDLGIRAEEKFKCLYVQTYGATDSGPMGSSSIKDSREVRLRTVGRPYEGCVIKVVDDKGNPSPPGEVGEIIVPRNPYSVSGYYNNPELNRSSWETGSFDLGETGRFDEDGNLTLVGRKRDAIKRGGQRIYPKEIEEFIIQHPAVSDVAVVGMPDAEMGEKVCAYIVPKPNQRIGLEEIVAFLKSKKVTSFLLPERVELIDELPLVPAGQKVDKKQLEEDIANKVKQEIARNK
jgi:non-ribosomal peptide synthetase component E (peptide arylation enzyme)